MERLKAILEEAGMFQYGVLPTEEIHFSDEVRGLCEANACRQYGKTWACPPAVGSVKECRERIRQYETMVLFSGKYDIEDSFDLEGMMDSMKRFKQSCRRLGAVLRTCMQDYILFSNEGCDLCEVCTYPQAPCRFPDLSYPSLEGYGLIVQDLAQRAGINYINGRNTVTYFGALVCHSLSLERSE